MSSRAKLRQDKIQKRAKRQRLAVSMILVVIGLLLVFSNTLTLLFLDYLGRDKSPGQGLEPNYDASQVVDISPTNVAKASLSASDLRPEGQIAIPDIGMNLDVYMGLNNEHLLLGAGEQYPRDEVKMGDKGKNYVLASHQSEDRSKLFTPLENAKAGQKVYLFDGGKLYTYEIEWNKVIHESETQYINEQPDNEDEGWLTLYTCTSIYSQFERRVVRAKLVDTNKVPSGESELLDPFLTDKSGISGYLKYYYLGYY